MENSGRGRSLVRELEVWKSGRGGHRTLLIGGEPVLMWQERTGRSILHYRPGTAVLESLQCAVGAESLTEALSMWADVFREWARVMDDAARSLATQEKGKDP